MHHAQPRATNDLDIFIGTDPHNAARVWRAMAEFGAALDDLSLEEFQDPNTAFRMGAPPIMVEVLRAIDGISFDDAYGRRLDTVVNAESGLTASYISRDDLLTNKRAANRARDIADVEAILDAAEPDADQPPPGERGRDDDDERTR